MSDLFVQGAEQVVSQNRQDQRSLREELRGLRHLLSAIVLQEGGQYRLGDRARLAARPDDNLAFLDDVDNRCLRIRRNRICLPASPAVVASDRLPDWML